MVPPAQKYQFSDLKDPPTAKFSGGWSMNSIRVVHLDPTRELTSSFAHQLHCQPAVTCWGSPLKINF